MPMTDLSERERLHAENAHLRAERDALRAEVLQLRKNLLRTWAAAEVREYDLRKLVALSPTNSSISSSTNHETCDFGK